MAALKSASTIYYYSAHASEFDQKFHSLEFEAVCAEWLPYLGSRRGDALDIGAGSGRDAAGLARMGFKVTAVEPAKGLREAGKQHYPHLNWQNSSLPYLRQIHQQQKLYDLILANAVWMHVPVEHRQRAFQSMASLLAPGGTLVITLRHGGCADLRHMYPVSANELKTLGKSNHLNLILHNSPQADLLGQKVTWETMVFRAEH